MGHGLSRNRIDRNQEPEPGPVNEQLQNLEAGSSRGIERLQNQEDEQPQTDYVHIKRCVTLHKAALQGDWETAKKTISEELNLANIPITERGDTALHLAAAGSSVHFVQHLLEKMLDSSAPYRNSKGQTAFCYAAIGGHVEIAQKMLETHGDLICRREGYLPLFYAAWQGNNKMAYYLFDESMTHFEAEPERPEVDQVANGESVTQARTGDDQEIASEESVSQTRPQEDQNAVEESGSSGPQEDQNANRRPLFHSWPEQHQIQVLLKCIHSGLYDLAVKIVNAKRELAVVEAEENSETPLLALARKPLAFHRTRRQGCTILSCFNRKKSCDDVYKLLDTLWEQVIRRHDVETQLGERLKQLLFIAAESENDGFLIELISQFPDFIYKFKGAKEHTIFHIAVQQRSVDVFNLLYELNGVKDLMISFIDPDSQNNILHLAAELPQQNKLNAIPGAALQMQREVLWYKEVEKVVPANYITMKNVEDKTPHEMFSKKHENLMKEGEKQIKQIAKACMLVTTLITTIVFTTAFTVPGGYNNKGAPILQHKEFFVVLPISQAIGTLASLFSMLMFLSVLSSRFSENNFLTSLPLWLVLGVTSLFLSVVAMLVAFCRCLFFYELGFAVKVALLVPFAIIPIIFLFLKFKLFWTIFLCTFSSKWLFRSNNRFFS